MTISTVYDSTIEKGRAWPSKKLSLWMAMPLMDELSVSCRGYLLDMSNHQQIRYLHD